MNKGTLEHVTECVVKRLSRESYGLFEDEGSEPLFTEKGKKESLVYQKLHDAFWKMRQKQVLERDQFKCVKCSSRLGLSVDHIVNRSQRGTHNMNNLQLMCAICHDNKTLLRPGWNG